MKKRSHERKKDSLRMRNINFYVPQNVIGVSEEISGTGFASCNACVLRDLYFDRSLVVTVKGKNSFYVFFFLTVTIAGQTSDIEHTRCMWNRITIINTIHNRVVTTTITVRNRVRVLLCFRSARLDLRMMEGMGDGGRSDRRMFVLGYWDGGREIVCPRQTDGAPIAFIACL